MKIEIPDEIIDDVRLIDAANSGRATENVRNPEEFRKTFEELHRLEASVADRVLSVIWRAVRAKR